MHDPRPAGGRADARRPVAIHSQFADDADFRPILAEFVRGLDDRIAALRDARDREAWGELQTFAHQLKGSGAGYGYPTLSEAALAVEGALKADERDRVDPLLDDLCGQCRAAVRGFHADLAA